MKATRQEVYNAIDSERAYQDRQWPNAEWGGDNKPNPNPLTVGEFLELIDELRCQARAQWYAEKKPNMATLGYVRKIAAAAVNCMEQHGAIPRA